MKKAQHLWNDPKYVALLQKLWKQPSSIASMSIIGRLAGITEPEHGYDQNGLIVLDVGCGVGRMERLFKHAKYKGVDSSQEMVRICTSRGLNVSLGSVYKIQEPDNSVDLVICHAVLFHIGGVNQAVAELWRVTKGRLIFSVYYSVPTVKIWPPTFDLAIKHNGPQPTWSEDADEGLGWWSVQNIVPWWQVIRLIKKYIRPKWYKIEWHKRIEHCDDKIAFCVLDK